MKIEYKNHTYEFAYYEGEDCWVAQERINMDQQDLFMEIHLKDFQSTELDKEVVASFLVYINDNLTKSLDIQARQLLNSASKISHWTDTQHIDKYSFKLDGIFYKEPKLPVFNHQEIEFNYSLVYKLYNSDFLEPFDPYTSYIVDFRNTLMTGCKRE